MFWKALQSPHVRTPATKGLPKECLNRLKNHKNSRKTSPYLASLKITCRPAVNVDQTWNHQSNHKKLLDVFNFTHLNIFRTTRCQLCVLFWSLLQFSIFPPVWQRSVSRLVGINYIQMSVFTTVQHFMGSGPPITRMEQMLGTITLFSVLLGVFALTVSSYVKPYQHQFQNWSLESNPSSEWEKSHFLLIHTQMSRLWKLFHVPRCTKSSMEFWINSQTLKN